ncbi:hypothetical protein Mgra_00006737 [Meloidogyne graminicola]|uniref:Uncharacterized protein n=1 Tax=Meloidogyne graminicola TaxID=189291 RepID=A0A8S9ZL10_9BILA|nr:hypothetical protein Mgra_00006737 [Meloidogyne graminicola]
MDEENKFICLFLKKEFLKIKYFILKNFLNPFCVGILSATLSINKLNGSRLIPMHNGKILFLNK